MFRLPGLREKLLAGSGGDMIAAVEAAYPPRTAAAQEAFRC
jgi:hypothetical protein